MGLIQAMLITMMLVPSGNFVTPSEALILERETTSGLEMISDKKDERKVLMNNKVIEYKKTFYIT